jgi:hypothetical protein
MILTRTHRDYSGRQPYLGAYERSFENLNAIESSWRGLPSDVAWLQRRSQMKLSALGKETLDLRTQHDRRDVQRLGEHPWQK